MMYDSISFPFGKCVDHSGGCGPTFLAASPGPRALHPQNNSLWFIPTSSVQCRHVCAEVLRAIRVLEVSFPREDTKRSRNEIGSESLSRPWEFPGKVLTTAFWAGCDRDRFFCLFTGIDPQRKGDDDHDHDGLRRLAKSCLWLETALPA